MKYLVLWCSLNCLFFINTVYSTVTIQPLYTVNASKVLNFTYKESFNVSCDVTTDTGAAITVEWFKGNKSVTEVLKDKASFKQNGSIFSLIINQPDYGDSGNYSCKAKAGTETAEETIMVISSVEVNIKPDDMVAIEGEKLQIVCLVLGDPLPDLSWSIKTTRFNESLVVTENVTQENIFVYSHKGDNGPIIPNSYLVVQNVTEDDRGYYTCHATPRFAGEERNHTAFVRIKDKYAALWPFLGICVEVIVLCAIIIIYEKKRNKTELEESDTDQSPDQKNTPDHGKETNLRHRQ